MPHTASSEMQQCIDNCTACHAICIETANHCLSMGKEHAEPHHINTLLDCADICATSADFMLRSSEYHPKTCGVCAELCRACAESCRAFPDDAQMQQCADMCDRCAESCERMAQMGATH